MVAAILRMEYTACQEHNVIVTVAVSEMIFFIRAIIQCGKYIIWIQNISV